MSLFVGSNRFVAMSSLLEHAIAATFPEGETATRPKSATDHRVLPLKSFILRKRSRYPLPLIDIARLAGVNVIALAGSEEKCNFARERKATHVINHKTENVVERVNAVTNGRGADIIFNHVAGKTFVDDLKMIAPLGLIVNYAVLGGMPETDLFKDMRANINRSPALRCFTMHTSDELPELRSEGMKHAIEFLAAGKFSPAIGARLPLVEARRAHEMLESRAAMGKIVLKP